MYKYQSSIKLISISLILAAGINVLLGYSFIPCLAGILLANTVLQNAYNYTISSNRPITFTLVFMLYLCLGGYSDNYASKYMNSDGIIKVLEHPVTGSILFLSCLTIIFINISELKKVLVKNTYLWFPSNYIFIFIAFIVINFSEIVAVSIKRSSYFIMMIGIIVLCFLRNEIKITKNIEYELPLKNYIRYAGGVFILILIVVVSVPKPKYLPGAKFIQSMTLKSIGDVSGAAKLNRNPIISDEMLFRVYAEKPLHLRSIAYSKYQDGIWSIDMEDDYVEPLIDNDFIGEFDVFYSKSEPEIKVAYIMEFSEYKNYLTVNGTRIILPDSYISIVGDKNNICFKEDEYQDNIAYTIKYYDKKNSFNSYEGAAEYSRSRESWIGYLRSRNLLEANYILSSSQYEMLKETYTQIPKELYEPLRMMAVEITNKAQGDIQRAERIEKYLKIEGGYEYVLGARKKDNMADPIYDFLINGKEGICQDFASGMVLLCRSIGIPARYVTGYYSDEINQDGDYIVRSKHAHAFVEVYISGYGWMLFDPTPPGSVGVNVGMNSQSGESDEANIIELGGSKGIKTEYKYSGIIFISIIVMIALWVIKVISFIIWKNKLLKTDTSEAITILYAGLIDIIEGSDIEVKDYKNTTKLTEDMLKQGIDILAITKPFEEYYYGNKKISKNEIKRAISRYEEIKNPPIFK